MFFNRKAKEYTPNQQAFLAALRDPANKGDLKICKEIAGYDRTTTVGALIKGLKDEIIDIAKEMLAGNAVKASIAIVEGLDDPTALGIRDRATNAQAILDRVGVIKGERVVVDNAPNRIALLPRRNDDTDE